MLKEKLQRLLVCTVGGIILAACSVQPLYNRQDIACGIKLNKISQGDIPSHKRVSLERAFSKAWDDRLICTSTDIPTQYSLDLNFKRGERAALIQGDTTVARTHLSLTVQYKLYDQHQHSLTEGQLILIDSYDLTESHLSSFVVEEEIGAQLMRNAALEVQMAIATYLAQKGRN